MRKDESAAIRARVLGLGGVRVFGFGVGLLAGALFLSACGSSSTSPTTTTTEAHPSNAETTASIVTNWNAFFSGATSATRKIALLQSGSEFAQVINGQASSTIAKGVTSKVLDVSKVTSQSAQVRYDIYMGSTKALAGQTGTAIKQGGSWKVSDASFCVLLGLEQTKVPMCPTS